MPSAAEPDAMTQLYLCEEPYWSKYDNRSEICPQNALQINVISDGKEGQINSNGVKRNKGCLDMREEKWRI
jgi:hypothetical protein